MCGAFGTKPVRSASDEQQFRYFRAIKASKNINFLESLILAQDERWRRA